MSDSNTTPSVNIVAATGRQPPGASVYDHATYRFLLYHVTVPLCFGLISIVGCVGNMLVIYVIVSKKQMRTVTNLLLLNLALADFVFAVAVPPFTAYAYSSEVWLIGDVLCKLMHYVINVTAYVAVYTLVLVSAVRYMIVVHNTRTMHIRTRRNVTVTVIAIWIVMIAVNVPVLQLYAVDEHVRCYAPDHLGLKLFATFFVCAYLLPLIVIGLFSISILRYIKIHKAPDMRSEVLRARSENKKAQASRLLVVVVVIFTLLWMPIHVHLLVYHVIGNDNMPDNRFYEVASLLWNVLAYINSCVNPFIYNHTSKDFRDAFREVMPCFRPCAAAAASCHQARSRARSEWMADRQAAEAANALGLGRTEDQDLGVPRSRLTTATSCRVPAAPEDCGDVTLVTFIRSARPSPVRADNNRTSGPTSAALERVENNYCNNGLQEKGIDDQNIVHERATDVHRGEGFKRIENLHNTHNNVDR